MKVFFLCYVMRNLLVKTFPLSHFCQFWKRWTSPLYEREKGVGGEWWGSNHVVSHLSPSDWSYITSTNLIIYRTLKITWKYIWRKVTTGWGVNLVNSNKKRLIIGRGFGPIFYYEGYKNNFSQQVSSHILPAALRTNWKIQICNIN